MIDYTNLSLDYMQSLFENKEISLVCNGESLLSRNYPDLIDSADIVIRFNNGCFIYQNHINKVGKRCDIFCLNGYYYQAGSPKETFDNFKNDTSDKIIFFTRPLEAITDTMKKKHLFVSEEYIKNLTNKSVFFIPAALLINHNFTSGLVVFLFLVKYTQFKKIKIFGMDFFQGSKLHYWEDILKTKPNVHHVLFEQYLLKYMASKSKKIRIF